MANILQIIPQIGAGGAEKIVFETAKAVLSRNDKCFVFTSGGFLQSEFEKIGANVIIGPAKSKNPFKVLIQNPNFIKTIIKQNNIDLIHVHSRAPAISAKIAAQAMNIPWVATYHGIYPAKNSIKRAYNSIMTKADIVIANSQFTKDYLINQHHPNQEKIRLVYCGIDSNEFDAKAINAERLDAIKAKIGCENTFKILLPARLTSWKGQLIAIEAARILRQKNRDFALILMGDSQGRDDYVNEIDNKIQEYNLAGFVKRIGHFNDVAAAMHYCDLIITPSTKPEAFGLSAAEAQMMGKIAIASRLGASVETISDNETGFLFETNNAADLAQKIEITMDMGDITRNDWGNRARNRAVKMFDTLNLHLGTLKIYDELIKAHK